MFEFRSSLARLIIVVLLAVVAVRGASPQESPRQTDVREEVETRLIQVDVSVLKPGGRSYASVPGLTLDHFEIRLDGKVLTPEERAQVIVDPICSLFTEEGVPAAPAPSPSGTAPRPVIVVADFNYLDARGRHRVAATLDALAGRVEAGEEGDATYRVYGLTREVRALTQGFTRAPTEIRAAAALIRQTLERPDFVDPDESDVPSSERTAISEFNEGPFEIFSGGNEGFVAEVRYSDIWGDAGSNYRPSASIYGLESILRANAHLRGRKAVILFSSEAFRFAREDRLEMETTGIRELGRQGFTIWTVDVEGVGRRESGASELLSMLAQDTGGDSVRKTNNLLRAFDGVREQLACYYLFSVPVSIRADGSSEHDLSIRINAEKYPDLWGHRVVAPAKLRLADDASRLRQRRIAALFSPDDYAEPTVTTTIGYPVPSGDREILPVSVRVPLTSLTWIPFGDGVRARLLIDAVVNRNTGRGSAQVCQTNTDELGVLELTLPRAPRASQRAGLAVQVPCLHDEDGLLVARGVVTDLESGKTGGGRSSALVRHEGAESWEAHAVRIQATSGRDLVWTQAMKAAQRDRRRQSWRVVGERETATVEDRIALRYVLCGPSRAAAGDAVRHVLVRLGKGGGREIVESLPADALRLPPGGATDEPFCSPALVTFPEYSMEPGDYGIAILDATSDDALALEILGGDAPPDAIFGSARFVVEP